MNEKLKRYLYEFLGALLLTAFSCGILLFSESPVSSAIAIGLCVMALTAVFMPFSGAHFNPVISIALLIKKKLDTVEFLLYCAAQLAGAFAGFGIAVLIEGGAGAMIGSEVGYLPPQSALFFEAFCAFAFTIVFLEISSKASSAFAAIIIGAAASFVLAWSLNVTGSVINPFRSLAAAVFTGGIYLADLWIFMLAPFAGGALAGLVHSLICED